MSWQPIGRAKPSILGVSQFDAARLSVEILLDVDPPPEWTAFFLAPQRVRLDPTAAAPTVAGRAVRMETLDSELETCVRLVDARIATANAQYADEVAPRLRAASPRTTDADVRRDQRLAEARRRADLL